MAGGVAQERATWRGEGGGKSHQKLQHHNEIQTQKTEKREGGG
jgi:hypothetical protein